MTLNTSSVTSPCCSTGPWPALRAPLWWSGSSREWRRSCRSSRSVTWNTHKRRLTNGVFGLWNVTSLLFAASRWHNKTATAVALWSLMIQSLLCHVSHWLISWFCCPSGVKMEYRQAGRVSVLQKGLKNYSKVVSEEPVAVQQLLQSFLWTEANWKSIHQQYSWFTTTVNKHSSCKRKSTSNVLG